MRGNAVFVTATGTDVGKTYISALLVKKMCELNYNCSYYKPALSGAVKQPDGSLLPGDCDYVIKISGLDTKPTDCLTYCFEEAVSPHLAAKRIGQKIEISKIQDDFDKISQKYDYLVVEGAGGITCPFNLDNEILLLPDIIKALNLDIIIVADGGLGSINSVLLTVEYAKSHNINIKGIILNNYDNTDFMHIDNKLQIERLTGIRVIATVAKNDTEIIISDEDLTNLFR